MPPDYAHFDALGDYSSGWPADAPGLPMRLDPWRLPLRRWRLVARFALDPALILQILTRLSPGWRAIPATADHRRRPATAFAVRHFLYFPMASRRPQTAAVVKFRQSLPTRATWSAIRYPRRRDRPRHGRSAFTRQLDLRAKSLTFAAAAFSRFFFAPPRNNRPPNPGGRGGDSLIFAYVYSRLPSVCFFFVFVL
jgi:hypothetical protein